ncbi:MAG: hypothetical protein Q7R92_03665 [bacterium]|nr:hypothetical protein [bacterium]
MRKKRHKTIIALPMILLVLGWALAVASPAPILAATNLDQIWGNGVRNEINNGPLGGVNDNDPRLLAVKIINIALGFLGIIAVILILYAGFRWMTAGGNEENVAAAKKILIAGVIGLVIILASFALANFVINQLIGATTGTIPT